MSASLPRKYYCVAYAELDTIPKKEGNVICTYDTDGWYYDIANPAGSASDSEKDIIRRKAGAIEFVAGFPPEVIDPDDSNKYSLFVLILKKNLLYTQAIAGKEI